MKTVRQPTHPVTGCLAIVVFLAAIPVCFLSFDRARYEPGDSASAPVAPPDLGLEAFNAARAVCRQNLRSPRSAKFCLPEDPAAGWQPWGTNRWRTWGWVDAQNAFGAEIRSPWQAAVALQTNRLIVTWLKIDSEEVGDWASWLIRDQPVEKQVGWVPLP